MACIYVKRQPHPELLDAGISDHRLARCAPVPTKPSRQCGIELQHAIYSYHRETKPPPLISRNGGSAFSLTRIQACSKGFEQVFGGVLIREIRGISEQML